MKIMHISNSVIPSMTANSIQVMKMCNSLSEIGHELCLLAICGEGNHDVFNFYNVNNSFALRLSKRQNSKFNILFYLKNLLKFKPDLVYGRNLYGCYLAALLGFPVYYEIHNADWRSGFIAPIIFGLFNKNKNLKKIISITSALSDAYKSDWPNSVCQKYQTLPDGADLPDANLVYKKKIADTTFKEKLIVGYVGSLFQGKGMEVIQKVAPLLTDVQFHIVGGTQKMIKRWKSLMPFDNVTFHGYVQPHEIESYYETMDVCLLPNQRVTYGAGRGRANIADFTSPLKLFEYMSHRKAIIASDLSVFEEILKHNVNCLLVKPDNPDEWVNAIVLMKDSMLRVRLGDNAYREFEKKYTWRRRAENLLKNDVIYN